MKFLPLITITYANQYQFVVDEPWPCHSNALSGVLHKGVLLDTSNAFTDFDAVAKIGWLMWCRCFILNEMKEIDAKRRDFWSRLRNLSTERNSFCWDCPSYAIQRKCMTRLLPCKIYLLKKPWMLNWQKSMLNWQNLSRLQISSSWQRSCSGWRRWQCGSSPLGDSTRVDFEPKAHWDLGEDLVSLTGNAVVAATGARFFYKGPVLVWDVLSTTYVGWAWQGRLLKSSRSWLTTDSMFGTINIQIQGRYFWIER